MVAASPDLMSLPLLAGLPPDARRLVAGSFTLERHPFGQVLTQEGSAPDAVFVLISGRARTLVRSETGEQLPLGSLGPGELFGEEALLLGGARRSTVRASAEVLVARLDASLFVATLRDQPELRSRLLAEAQARAAVRLLTLRRPLGDLPLATRVALGRALRPESFPAGARVISEGDPGGPLYLVEQGRLRVFLEREGQRTWLSFLRPGDLFGEVAAMSGQRRVASVDALDEARVLSLAPDALARLLAEHPALASALEDRIRAYRPEPVARVPLDFAEEELPLAGAGSQVGVDQLGGREEARFSRRAKRIRSFELIRQIDEADCGPACLAMVCQHYKRRIPLTQIRRALHTGLDGTSLRALVQGAESLGLAARAVRVGPEQLDQLALPAILHWEGRHWVVVYDTNPRFVHIADPALGLRRVPHAEFLERWNGYAALFDYTQDFERTPERGGRLGWFLPFLRPHAGVLLRATALAAAASLLELLPPVFVQLIFDRVLPDRDPGLLWLCLLGMGVALALGLGASLLQRWLLSFVAVRTDASSLDALSRQLLSLPLSYFVSRRTGDLQRRLSGLRQLRDLVVRNGVTLLSSLCQLGAALGMMLLWSPLIGATFLLTLPLYGLLLRASTTRLRPVYAALEEAGGRYQAMQIDAIKGIETVKALGAEDRLRERLLDQLLALAERQFAGDFTAMAYGAGLRAVGFVTQAAFLGVAAREALAGRLSAGEMAAMVGLLGLAIGPLQALLGTWDELQLGRVLLDRLEDVIDQEPEQAEGAALRPVRSLGGDVRTSGLTLQVGGPGGPKILDDLSLDIRSGTRVAIVGRSGSGKTTLARCLAGLLRPTDGVVEMDGVRLDALRLRELRRQIGFVPQEIHLFDDTLAANIALGDPEPDLERVRRAARIANAHEFIDRLPLGYETRVGESGLALSGGQRQRVAIARAVYHDPPILIFDEATSALDTESERAVQENIERLLRGRTSFVIAHRMSTVRDADLILVLERGRVVEQGRHAELLARQGAYARLVGQQVEA